MDPRFQTSFIPKKPIISQAGGHIPTAINLFALLATVIFIVAIAVSGGVFFYDRLLVSQINDNKASLERAKGAFEPELINQIIRLDTRIETAVKLLKSHVSVTPFFDFLSTITLRSVRFKDFNFSYLAPDKILVEMKGQAQSYAAVALQSDLINKQKNLHDSVVGNMSLDPTGTVSFSVSTTVDPSLLSYETAITGGTTTQVKAPAVSNPVSVSATSTTPNATSTTQQ